jgi:hypothetical protein
VRNEWPFFSRWGTQAAAAEERPRLATRRQVTNLEPPFVSQVDISSAATIYQQQLHTLCVVCGARVCVFERERAARRFSSTLSAIFPAAVVLLITRHSSRPGEPLH